MSDSGYLRIAEVLQRKRDQSISVQGKSTPFRVEFRFRGGTKHYQYFEDRKTAENASDCMVYYRPNGMGVIEKPLSQQIQVMGPRKGWKPLAKVPADCPNVKCLQGRW